MKFPEHKAGLSLEHNTHKSYYEPIAEYVQRDYILKETTAEERKAIIEADSIWELQWYPDTPIGFYKVFGATLEEVLRKANE